MSKIKEMKIISSLEKIYDSDSIPEKALESFSMLRNEKKSFQIAIDCTCEGEADLIIESSFSKVKTYSVEHIKSDYPMDRKTCDDYYRYSESGYFPDLLLPTDGKVSLKKGINVYWVELDGKVGTVGTQNITVTVGDTSANLTVEIINADLDFADFAYTTWFHTDCLMSYYKFDAFSDEYWRVTSNFLKTAADYGMSCVLTPIFTPALDTEIGKERPTVQLVDVTVKNGVYSFSFDKLTKWIEMSENCGIKYFELSHFYTQWGARHAPKIMATVDGVYKKIFGWETKATSREYKDFLTAFSVELNKYLEERNLKDRVFLHVSDEPSLGCMLPYYKAAKHIKKVFKGYKIMDALSDYNFYKLGIVSNPIPSNNHIEKFLGNVDGLWTYYCSGQNNKYVSNRFFCNDSIRNRVLGYQLFKYDIVGFLQWGYNFYYTQLSKALVDPYKVSDAGGKFPSGDSYVVYPAADGTANPSIRLMVFFDALQDMAALNTLKKLSDKKTCLDIIEESGKHNLTFSNYPHEDEWLLNTREKVNMAIKERI